MGKMEMNDKIIFQCTVFGNDYYQAIGNLSLRSLSRFFPQAKILMYTTHDTPECDYCGLEHEIKYLDDESLWPDFSRVTARLRAYMNFRDLKNKRYILSDSDVFWFQRPDFISKWIKEQNKTFFYNVDWQETIDLYPQMKEKYFLTPPKFNYGFSLVPPLNLDHQLFLKEAFQWTTIWTGDMYILGHMLIKAEQPVAPLPLAYHCGPEPQEDMILWHGVEKAYLRHKEFIEKKILE